MYGQYLASELIIQPKLLSFRCFLIFTLLWINLMLHSLHYSMHASSAFDRVDHEIVLQRLETSFGLSGSPLNWFRSYLSDRSQMVALGDTRVLLGSWVPVQFGVPQGSVLGPLLYILFTADISRLFAKYSVYGYLYADDVQAYVHGPPSQFLDIISSIASLAADLDSWMSSNRLSLNPSKTQLIWLGTRQQLLKLDFPLFAVQILQFTFLTYVRDLGVTLDNTLSFSAHISNLSRSSFYHLRRLRASDALSPLLYLSLWSMPLSVPGLIIVTPSSLGNQNPAWLYCNLSLVRLLV